MALLAACQSAPAASGFSAAQIATLRSEGFVDTGLGWELNMPERLLFPSDKRSIPADQQRRFTDIAAKLVSVGIAPARVEGHTASTGKTGRAYGGTSVQNAYIVSSILLEKKKK